MAAHGGFNNAPIPRLPHTQQTMTVHCALCSTLMDVETVGIMVLVRAFFLIITNTIDQISSTSASYLSQQVLLIFLAELSLHLSGRSSGPLSSISQMVGNDADDVMKSPKLR